MINTKIPTKIKKASEFESKLLEIKRVARVTKGGKKMRFRAVVIVGNKRGKVGVGVAKGLDVSQAVEKATRVAERSIIEVTLIQDTIPHKVEGKFKAAKVLLKPQRGGRGLVAGGTVRVLCSLAGINNISAKVLGKTGNKINNAMAVIVALQKLKKPKTEITYAASSITQNK